MPKFPILLAVSICTQFPLSALAQDHEQRAMAIYKQLQRINPAELDRYDKTSVELLEQLEHLGAEARCAIPSLKKFAILDNLVGYRASSQRSAVRTLASMGDEGIPALREALKCEDRQSLYWILSELTRIPLFDTAAVYPELMDIANRDQDYPGDEVIEAEIKAFKKAHPEVDLDNGFFAGTTGSKSFDAFRELEINTKMAIELLQNSTENREQLKRFIIERFAREENPSFQGIMNFKEDSLVISALKSAVLSHKNSNTRIDAAFFLAELDPKGNESIPVLLKLLADDHDSKTYSRVVEILKNHPVHSTFDRSKILSAIKKIPMQDRASVQQSLLAKKSPRIEQLTASFEKLRSTDQRKAHQIAAQIIRQDPSNKDVVDFLLELVNDETKPSQVVLSRGFGRPGPPGLRPLAARDLGFVGSEHRTRVLKVLRKHMLDNSGSPGYSKPTDLATSAAWSVAQLDQKDTNCLRFVNEISNPFSTTNIARPFYGQSGKFVAEVLGERIELVGNRLVKQALSYSSNSENTDFARNILLNAKLPAGDNANSKSANADSPRKDKAQNPYFKLLVTRAFKMIRGEVTQRGVGQQTLSAIAISFLQDHSDQLHLAYETICSQSTAQSYEARIVAVYLLGKMHKRPQTSVQVLMKACKDRRALIRCNAAKALANFGPEAGPALSQLEDMLNDDYESVRNAAEKAIAAVRRNSSRQ